MTICIFSSLMFLSYVYRLLDLNLTIWIYVPVMMSLMILKVCLQHYFPHSVRINIVLLYRVTWGMRSEAQLGISPQEVNQSLDRDIGRILIKGQGLHLRIKGETRTTYRWLRLEILMPAGQDTLPWCDSDSIPSSPLIKWGGLERKGSAMMSWINS